VRRLLRPQQLLERRRPRPQRRHRLRRHYHQELEPRQHRVLGRRHCLVHSSR
jgi:hypothetical protein